MSVLFFDVETTGKADMRSTPEASHQPRLVQLGAILTDDFGKELSSLNLIIKPQSWTISEEVAALHGITHDIATKYGVSMDAALHLFAEMARMPKIIAAHNVDFDLFIMTGEYIRLGATEMPMDGAESFCTMRQMTDYCKLPGSYSKYKWPKLQEAYFHCFQEQLVDAHNALADVRACSRVYWWLKTEREKAKQ